MDQWDFKKWQKKLGINQVVAGEMLGRHPLTQGCRLRPHGDGSQCPCGLTAGARPLTSRCERMGSAISCLRGQGCVAGGIKDARGLSDSFAVR